jgi:hypothetical protein
MARRPTNYDPEGDDEKIVQKFMHELCRRDDEDNRGGKVGPDRQRNVFPTQQIQQEVLGAVSLEHVILALRGYMLENRDNEPFEFLDDEKSVKLTHAGRARCDENGL